MPSKAEKRFQRRQYEQQQAARQSRTRQEQQDREEVTSIPLTSYAGKKYFKSFADSLVEEGGFLKFGDQIICPRDEFRLYLESVQALMSDHIFQNYWIPSNPKSRYATREGEEFEKQLRGKNSRALGRDERAVRDAFLRAVSRFDYAEALLSQEQRRLYEHVMKKQEEDDLEERHRVPPMDRLLELAQRYDPIRLLRAVAEILEEQEDLENLCDILEPEMKMREESLVSEFSPDYRKESGRHEF
jgi:cyclopropane fatty-acyl-phospholipid synthase-like methyltransferase